MKTIPSVEVLMWVEHWKLSYKDGEDINLAFIKVEDMSTVQPSYSVPRNIFEKFLHMYIGNIKECSKQLCYNSQKLRKKNP